MKNKYLYLKVILLSAIFLTSCSDFLEPDPREDYTAFDAWRSLENTNLYVNGFYKPIYDYGPLGNTYASVGMSDGLTDILRYNSSGFDSYGGDLNKVVYNGQISNVSNPLENYSYLYNRIRRINEFLYGLDKYTNYAEEDNNRLVAQARFFRAFLYTILIRNRGSVILRKELDGPKQASKARSPESECWDFVEKDLDFAGEHLPKVWENPNENLGRLTKGAVYGFKSRAMLYAKRWESAVNAAERVIAEEGNLYDLMTNYANAFSVDDNKEVVLGFRFGGAVTHNFNRWYAPSGDSDLDRRGLASPTQELVDSYKMADGSAFSWDNPEHAKNPYANREPRFYASILYNGAPWKGRVIETFVGGKDGYKQFASEVNPNATTTGYFFRKLLDENHINLEEKSVKDWTEVRYAEVLLNHAEALSELGKTSEALTSLNKVIERAKLPKISGVSKDQLTELIREERKVELAFEGHRYWDLRRWRKAVEVLKGKRMHGIKITKNEDASFNYEVVEIDDRDRFFEERYYKFPIPLQELKNNPKATQIENW